MMIYSDNMIAWKNNCNVSSDPNDARCRSRSIFLVLSVRRRHIFNPSQFLTVGAPAEIRRDIGVVPIQDHLPSTASLLLHRTSPESGFQGVIWQTYYF